MSQAQNPSLSVSDVVALTNQTLEYAFGSILVEGEVESFKVNHEKYVFFKLVDKQASVDCFMTVWQLRFPIEDGQKIVIRATPKLTTWGKFSLTVSEIQPVGKGSIKKSFDLLKQKLEKEGLFDVSKKRLLPDEIQKIAVISSKDAAGYIDFVKIVNERWGGLSIDLANVLVQGIDAPDQIMRALDYFNQSSEVYDVVAIIRGGGSTQDLAAFNDEQLTRKIASSRIIVATGIGHEVDESLSDLAADVVASTPSNLAQMLTKDRRQEMSKIRQDISYLAQVINGKICERSENVKGEVSRIRTQLENKISSEIELVSHQSRLLDQVNPDNILRRGYALIRGDIVKGSVVDITTYNKLVKAEVKSVKDKERQ